MKLEIEYNSSKRQGLLLKNRMKRYAELMGNHKINRIKSLLDNKLLGRLAILSCTDVATVNSYYNNTKYTYLMYKNGKGINIDRVSETPGEYKNGVEISAEIVITNSSLLEEAIEKLIMFDKLYIKYDVDSSQTYPDRGVKSTIEDFNNRKLTKFNTFIYTKDYTPASYATYYCSVGNVLYELPKKYVPLDTRGIIPYVPVGSVDIVPSREALQFTEKTENTLKEIYKKVIDEITEIVKNKFDGKNLTLKEYYTLINSGYEHKIEFDDKVIVLRDTDIENIIANCKIIVEGTPSTPEFVNYLKNIEYYHIPKESLYLKSKYADISIDNLILGGINLYYKSSPTFRAVTKSWFLDSVKDSRNWAMLNTGAITRAAWGIDKIESDDHKENEYFKFILEHIKITNVANEDVPQQYITEFKDTTKQKKLCFGVNKSRIPCRRYTEWGYHVDHFDLEHYKHPVFYAPHMQDDKDIRDFTNFLGRINSVVVVTVKAEYLPLFESDSRCTALSSIGLVKNNFIAKCVTYTMIWKELKNANRCPLLNEFYDKYRKYHDRLGNQYNTFIQDLIELYKTNGWYNKYDVEYFKLTDAEKEAIAFQADVYNHSSHILDAIIFAKYGRYSRIGIEKPKINLTKYLQK